MIPRETWNTCYDMCIHIFSAKKNLIVHVLQQTNKVLSYFFALNFIGILVML
jgi:hypothetical protein